MAASHFETGDYSAKSVFPCFDDPAFKANFTLTLVYPQKCVAISNTAEYLGSVSTFEWVYHFLVFFKKRLQHHTIPDDSKNVNLLISVLYGGVGEFEYDFIGWKIGRCSCE